MNNSTPVADQTATISKHRRTEEVKTTNTLVKESKKNLNDLRAKSSAVVNEAIEINRETADFTLLFKRRGSIENPLTPETVTHPARRRRGSIENPLRPEFDYDKTSIRTRKPSKPQIQAIETRPPVRDGYYRKEDEAEAAGDRERLLLELQYIVNKKSVTKIQTNNIYNFEIVMSATRSFCSFVL